MARSKQIEGWSNVPNSYVNNDGQPDLSYSIAGNDNNGRLAVRNEI